MATPTGYGSLPFLLATWGVLILTVVLAQQPISTSMPVPPLQWLNITALASTTSGPPPLSFSSIGYSELQRSLVIFGGESSSGVPQSQTWLLNMDSLTWSKAASLVSTRTSSPPARSRALGTGDFAANIRRDFLVFGGKGSDGSALGDVWAFNFLFQLWAQLTTTGPNPSPRWGTAGGIDPAVEPTSGNNVSTVFHIAGGTDGKAIFPSTELYRLVVTGSLAQDTSSITGDWQVISTSNALSGKLDGGGTLISQTQASDARIVISGGCGSNSNPGSTPDVSCVDPSTDVFTVDPSTAFSPPQCPVPRLGPVLVPNYNSASSAFNSQSFMLLGLFDTSSWNDSDGLARGEVAVLDVDGGTWARVLPAGDPSSPSPFPSPREGAAALSIPNALIGSNRSVGSDIIVFGGRDANGNYLNDLWILRAYNGTINHSGGSWAGFGDGQLQSGADASGAGVTVDYLSQCAVKIMPNSSSTSTSTSTTKSSTSTPKSSPTSTNPGSGPSSVSDVAQFDVSVTHKVLPPVSIATLLGAVVLLRYSLPSSSAPSSSQVASWYIAISVLFAAYAVGVAGFAISFTSLSHPESTLKRRESTSSIPFLPTGHARAGFALFILLYGVFTVLAVGTWLRRRLKQINHPENLTDEKEPMDGGLGIHEKPLSPGTTPGDERPPSPSQSAPEMHSRDSSLPSGRARTFSGPGILPGWRKQRISASEGSDQAPSAYKGFEVTNRPRRVSAAGALHPARDLLRSLNDLSWLERRRSVGAVGELDYALNQLGQSPRSVSPPFTSRPPTVALSNRPFVRTPTPHNPTWPFTVWDAFLHIFFHALLLANCILILIALFFRAPLAAFIVFLVWTVAFYICIFLLAWHGHPEASILSTAIQRLRTHPMTPVPQVDPSVVEEPRSPMASPYAYQQPSWRRAVSPLEDDRLTRTSHGRQTLDLDNADDDDDDDDEIERQRRMEEELERRDVHIITVPRKRLWIANPS
ncbi:hypothetical protein M422DRAFT_22661 [Sphaerobolus stellatus SS14]|nr:hypothetical protein M422DRAFT_22661 [Sphaerobolus stellatus SS14]